MDNSRIRITIENRRWPPGLKAVIDTDGMFSGQVAWFVGDAYSHSIPAKFEAIPEITNHLIHNDSPLTESE